MLLLWMVYAIALTTIVAGAALALERAASMWDVPRRAVWLAAIVAAVVTPVMLAMHRDPAPEAVVVYRPTGVGERQRLAPADVRLIAPKLPPRVSVAPAFSRRWDGPVRGAWLAASLLLLAFVARGVWSVRRRRDDWHEADLDGYRVLVAADVGPAVIGAWRPEIVVPTWTLTLDAGERDLVLRHETEHVAARDPLLLTLATLALVVFPWNAALWFVVRRLRLAVEIDCDGRVLRDMESPRTYGLLLLAVGARHTMPLPLAASLTERQPDLERRIIAMTSLRPSRPLLASLPFVGIATLGVIAVAQTPHPSPIVSAPAPRSAPAPAPVAVPAAPTPLPAAVPNAAPTPLPASVPAPSARPTEPAAAAQQEEKHITVRWEDAPTDTVLAVFERFTGYKIVVATKLPKTISADIVDVEWTTALRRILNGVGADWRLAPDYTIRIEAMSREVPLDSLAAWMMAHHPNVVRGDTAIGNVYFVIDADNKYLVSDARPRSAELAESVAAMKTATANGELARTPGLVSPIEVALRQLQLGSASISGSVNGVTIPTSQVDEVQVRSLRAGILSPNPLTVVIVFLKR